MTTGKRWSKRLRRMCCPTRGCLLAACLLGGCGENEPPPPATYAVTGVVYDAQGEPLRGGIIQFIPESNPALNMSSVIGDDGVYALQTIYGNRNLPGAIAGECDVLVMLPLAADEIPETVALSEPVPIAAQANTINLKLAPRATAKRGS